MGLFGTLLGWDQHKDAWNAALANDLVAKASPELKKQIADRLIIIQQQVRGASADTPKQVLEDLTRRPRMVQLNFVALACNSLGIPPALRGSVFEAVSNPYNTDSDSSKDRIEACLTALARKHGKIAPWPGNHIHVDFTGWTAARGDPVQSTESEMVTALHRLSTYGRLSEEYRQDTGKELDDYFDLLGLGQPDRDELMDAVYGTVGSELFSPDIATRDEAVRKAFEIIMKPLDDVLN